MSAKNRGAEVAASENYPTPEWPVHRLLETGIFDFPTMGLWAEPCAGEGAIIRAVESYLKRDPKRTSWPLWAANEIRPEALPELQKLLPVGSIRIGDFATFEPLAQCQVSITNPPFSLAMGVIEWGMTHADHVVILQRLNFLETPARHEFFSDFMPDVYVLPNRPAFMAQVMNAKDIEKDPTITPHVGVGTDATAYAWFHWPMLETDRGRTGKIQMLGITSKDELAAARRVILDAYHAKQVGGRSVA